MTEAQPDTENTDPTKSEDVGKRLGKSLFEGFNKLKSGILNPSQEDKGAAREMINTMGRNFLSASFATSGAMGAVNSGDPTQALIGQKMAQAVDQTLQKHWWIQKAKEFEKEKLAPMKKKFNTMKTGFDARSSELQRKMYSINNQFGADKEEAIRATIAEKKFQLDQGAITPEEFAKFEAEANAAIAENETNRNNAVGEVQAEYSSLMSDFNTMYSQEALNLINEAAMYDQSNPILGQLINNTVGIITNEANSFTSRLSMGDEALGAVQANDAFEYNQASRQTPAQNQRMNEAVAVRSEATASEAQTAALESQREFGRYKAPTPEEAQMTPPVEQVMNAAAESHRTGKSAGAAIKNTLSDNNLRAATQPEWQDDVENLSRALGYIVQDENGEQSIGTTEAGDPLTTEEELAALQGEFAEFTMALAAAKGIPGNENKNISELSDILDEINVKENAGLPSAINILQKRLAKEGIRVTPKEVSKALDQAQKDNPPDPEDMIANALDLLRQGKIPAKKTKDKDAGMVDKVVDAVKKTITGLFPDAAEKPSNEQSTSKPAEAPSEPPSEGQATAKSGILETGRTVKKAITGLLASPTSPAITPERLAATAKPAEQGKIYGALLKRKGEIQTELSLLEGNDEKGPQADALNKELKSLEDFIKYYQTNFPSKLFKELHNVAHAFLQSGKASKTVLSKYGMAEE